MKSANSADPCKRGLKVVSLRSLSSGSLYLPMYYRMMTIYASHIDSLKIVYEQFDGSGGEDNLIVEGPLTVVMGITVYRCLLF